MVNDERHMALPKLYGAPAYARPTVVPVAPVERPFDPDDMPLEVAQTREERTLIEEVVARPYPGGTAADPVGASSTGGREGSPLLRGRPFRLGSITGRIKGKGGPSADA